MQAGAGISGLSGQGSWSRAKLLSALCLQNLQSLLRQCRSLAHLSLAGTDCPLDAVSTGAGGHSSKPLPSAPSRNRATLLRVLLPHPRAVEMGRAWGSQPSDALLCAHCQEGLGDSGFSRRKKGAPRGADPLSTSRSSSHTVTHPFLGCMRGRSSSWVLLDTAHVPTPAALWSPGPRMPHQPCPSGSLQKHVLPPVSPRGGGEGTAAPQAGGQCWVVGDATLCPSFSGG